MLFKKDAFTWLDLFYQAVQQNPDSAALVFKGKAVTYLELDRLANWFAGKVVSLCSDGSPFVGVSMKRSSFMLAALIGIQKAGYAYLPIDPSFPSARQRHMVVNSGAELVFCDYPEAPEAMRESGGITFCSTADAIPSDAVAGINNISSASPAYILYTSGSTGKPKGVYVSQRAFLNFLLSMQERPGCTSADSTLAMTTISFDIAGLELFLPLICGGTVYLLDEDAVYAPEKVSELILSAPVSIVQATPTVWSILLESGFSGKNGLKLLCGGEALSLGLARRLLATGCEVWNMYGPTETTIWSSVYKVEQNIQVLPPIGSAIKNTELHIFDDSLKPVPPGREGQLWISGHGLAEGYWNNPELTSEVFRYVSRKEDTIRMYKTGDYVKQERDGSITFLGRKDSQIKMRGLRIDTGEIEEVLMGLPGIKDAVVLPRKTSSGDTLLVAYYRSESDVSNEELRHGLSLSLPAYMLPGSFIRLEFFPMTPNRKVDRGAFPDIEQKQTKPKMVPAIEDRESFLLFVRNLWSRELGTLTFRNDDNFFDVGGQSIQVIRILQKLSDAVQRRIEPAVFFQNPTVNSIVTFMSEDTNATKKDIIPEVMGSDSIENTYSEQDDFSLALVGLSCAVPGAEDALEFWNMLVQGKSGISEFSVEELIQAGLDPETVSDPRYIRKSGVLLSTPCFDHEFFGYSPKEARFMDPQQRLMLEHSYAALESAGIVPGKYSGKIAVFAGCGQNKYLLKNILFSSEKADWSDFQTMVGNGNDFLASRVSYKLNLKGPAITVQTACSTSLVAIQMAYQSLLNYQCDAALCGGVSLNVPVKEGYLYTEGTILSKDGMCRPFDADASGTVFGSGIGMVVLKRLKDAVEAGDPIIAVVRGAAINNDGSAKIGFTAPSVDGQANVIQDALGLAGVTPQDISYVETHGTGTIMGDPIEIAGLTAGFSEINGQSSPCYIGSVKANIGHLDAAAGVVGFIKTALALKNKQIPPLINFQVLNPEMKLEKTPFKVNTRLRDWPVLNGRRIAGVSSFGIGGTNAHVILESWDAPDTGVSQTDKKLLICPVTARHPEALNQYLEQIKKIIQEGSREQRINTVWTMMKGRADLPVRGYLVVPPDPESGEIEAVTGGKTFSGKVKTVFLFPGQGTQYAGMGKILYNSDPVFTAHINNAIQLIDSLTGWNSRDLLFESNSENTATVNSTRYTQPLLFSFEWALARTLEDYGVQCDFMTGHSLGEFTAACLSGAFSLDEGIRLVTRRGEIMSRAAEGSLLAVFAGFEEIEKDIPDYVDVAGINSPGQVVLSGAPESIQNCFELFTEREISCKILPTKNGFHSRLMDSILPEFRDYLNGIDFKPLKSAVISNLTGEVLSAGFLYTPEYWIKHLRSAVRFQQGILSLPSDSAAIYVEVGPGAVLSRLVRTIDSRKEKVLVQTIPADGSDSSDDLFFTKALGNIWRAGGGINVDGINGINNGRKLNLPTYPFIRTEHWIDADLNTVAGASVHSLGVAPDSSHETNRSAVEKDVPERLKGVWQQILGYEAVSDDANFFDLGGDSLLSAELVQKISREFGISIKLNDIIRNPVFSDMLGIVFQGFSQKKRKEDEFPILFPVQEKGRLPKLFLVAGAHENRYHDRQKMTSSYEEDFLRYFSSLIGFLGKEQPIYGFRPRGIRFGEKMHRNVQEMAAACIEELKKVQPEGPYYIGGECVGGMIAYEIAQQLTSRGDRVANLILMDTPRPGLGKLISEELFYYKQWLKKLIFRNFLNKEQRNPISNLTRAFSDVGNVLFAVTRHQKQVRQVLESSLFYQRKLLSYTPKPYEGSVTLIVNEEWHSKAENLNWDRGLLPNMEVHVVPGNHISRLSEHGRLSGEKISSIIRPQDAGISGNR